MAAATCSAPLYPDRMPSLLLSRRDLDFLLYEWLDIELLTIKLRLIVASVDTAKAMGIDWWTRDPFLNSGARGLELEEENERLRERLVHDGLDPVVKTSGSKGMQVYAPIRVTDREHPSRYAKQLAQDLSEETPDEVVFVLPTAATPVPLDPAGRLVCDWRRGDLW